MSPQTGCASIDELPWVTKTYKRDLDITRYNVPFLHHPFISLYTSHGCPAMCTFCLWPQTHSGHRWRLRSTYDCSGPHFLDTKKGFS